MGKEKLELQKTGAANNVSCFGFHLTLDMYGCSGALLNDACLLAEWLDTLPEQINMHPISPAFICRPTKRIPSDDGVTGVIIIEESHISVHTFIYLGEVYADVFSCGEFDRLLVIDMFKRAFNPQSIIAKSHVRGTRTKRTKGSSHASEIESTTGTNCYRKAHTQQS